MFYYSILLSLILSRNSVWSEDPFEKQSYDNTLRIFHHIKKSLTLGEVPHALVQFVIELCNMAHCYYSQSKLCRQSFLGQAHWLHLIQTWALFVYNKECRVLIRPEYKQPFLWHLAVHQYLYRWQRPMVAHAAYSIRRNSWPIIQLFQFWLQTWCLSIVVIEKWSDGGICG